VAEDKSVRVATPTRALMRRMRVDGMEVTSGPDP
jgi:hypothetical protein